MIKPKKEIYIKLYKIDSKDRSSYESITSFKYKLDYTYSTVLGAKIIDFISFNTIYTVNANNNKFTMTASSVDYSITLTNGFYTPATLATEIATRLNASGSLLTFTVSDVPLTSKFTIAAGSNFNLTFDTVNYDTGDLLGFSSNKTGSSSYTSDICYQLISCPYIIINIDELDIDYMIPINASPGSMVTYENRNINMMRTIVEKNISHLSIKIYNHKRRQVDFNGLNISMTLALQGVAKL